VIFMAYADHDQRRRLITGLRSLVTLLETRPEMPTPRFMDLTVFPQDGTDDAMRAEVDRIAALLGSKIDATSLDHGHYSTGRSFGPVRYEVTAVLSAARARHAAWCSYADSVTPDSHTTSMEM
jgi:hypothetical protein